MVRDRQKRESITQIRRLGVPIQVTDYERVDEDSYGSTVRETDESPYEIYAVPGPNAPTRFEAITGTVASYSITFYAPSRDVDGITGSNPSQELQSEITYNGQTFDVEEIHTNHEAGVAVIGADD